MRILLIIAVLLTSKSVQSQEIIPEFFEDTKKYVVSIGIINTNIEIVKGVKNTVHKFQPIGSGFVTYVNVDSLPHVVVITAGHVLDAIVESKRSSFYVRANWADTLSTIEYQGLQIPLYDEKTRRINIFRHKSENIDLGAIPISLYNTEFFSRMHYSSGGHAFPLNSIKEARTGDEAWIYGYPQHIQDGLSPFNYSICTFKKGIVTWVPHVGMKNNDLNHITLIESNATHGNSGGPVFHIDRNDGRIKLIGILVGGYKEAAEVYKNNSPVKDSLGNAHVAVVRSGVSIIEKSENIKGLLIDVQVALKERLTQKARKK